MLPEYPLVSIIIPVYNAEKFLANTIHSALGQTWQHKELIIVDDGSTDNSLAIAKSFSSDNVKVFSQQNKGASIARNRGLKSAQGDYIQFLDADDFISKEKIEGQIKILNGSTTKLSLCKTMYFYDGEQHLLQKPREDWYYTDNDDPIDFLIKLYSGAEIMPGYGGMIQTNSWLTPRALIDKAGMWNEFKCPDDDGEFFCRVLLVSEGVKFSDKGFNYYRRFRNQNSLSGQKDLEAYESILVSLELRYKYLKAKTDNPIIDKIFAWRYWGAAVHAYPQFKAFSKQAVQKAVDLGFNGRKYLGGPSGHKLADMLGWKFARYIVYYFQQLKKRLF